MEGIFFCIDKIGIPNIGLAIILFTILVNLLMLPLTIKQQKFAKTKPKITKICKHVVHVLLKTQKLAYLIYVFNKRAA